MATKVWIRIGVGNTSLICKSEGVIIKYQAGDLRQMMHFIRESFAPLVLPLTLKCIILSLRMTVRLVKYPLVLV